MCDCYYDEVICPECHEIVNIEDLMEHLKTHYKKQNKEAEIIEVKLA